ncbi:hypothetical protein MMC16_002832 [Acarospora aff. strigata]|nr:hypothetical protein [Acarospora aff. strigata]
MFRFHKPIDVITLFHSPARPASSRVLKILQQASAEASEPPPEPDQSGQSKVQSKEFELNVMEDPPTGDQLRSILEYVGPRRAGDLIKGARGEAEAMRKLQENGESFVRPVVVDWSNGRAVIGENESEILKMVKNEVASV